MRGWASIGIMTALSVFCACHPDGSIERTCTNGRFQVQKTTVRDTKTGLTWQAIPVAEKMTWDNATRYCQSIGMTLPASLALVELMKTGTPGKLALDACAFPGQSPEPETVSDNSDTYWSSTTQSAPLLGKLLREDQAMKVCVFGVGNLCSDSKTVSHRVRCVR